MASTEQIKANRLNALKSTGPRTIEGKARSSRNALTHGLTAQEIVIPGEDLAAYQSFEQQLVDDLHPNGSCELDLVERLAATFWRLRRIPRFEAALLAFLDKSILHSDAYEDAHYAPTQERVALQEQVNKLAATRWLGRDPYQLNVLGRVLRDALSGNLALLKLSAYEARLMRQSQQLLGQFFALRKVRAADLSLEGNAANQN